MSRWLTRDEDEDVQEKEKVPFLKKLVNIQIIISIVALAMIIILEILWGNKGPREEFLNDWCSGLLIIFVIPLVFDMLSLAYNADKIKPKVWLTIYGCAVIAYLIIAIHEGFANTTKDLPLAIREEYSMVSGTAQSMYYGSKTQAIEIGDNQFDIPIEFFADVQSDEEYTILYLPNSRYVIDIFDGAETSLLEK